MIKIDLSAMQKKVEDTTDLPLEKEKISQKEEVSLKSTSEIQSTPKKRISLNSLISGISDTSNSGKNIISGEEIEPKKSKIEEISILENKDTEIKEEKKESLKEEVIKISDGDTVGNLIVDKKKKEIFANYVSSFEKEIQAIKKKTEKKEEKEKRLENDKKIIEKAKNELDFVGVNKKDINLDEIIENIETKEEVVKNKIDFNFYNLFNKRNFAILFGIFLISFIVYFIGFTNFSSKIKTSTLNIPKIQEHKAKIPYENNNIGDKNPKENINYNNINYNTDNKELKEKLIKYFRNKQSKNVIE